MAQLQVERSKPGKSGREHVSQPRVNHARAAFVTSDLHLIPIVAIVVSSCPAIKTDV
jgi:hypothetical protein